MRKALPILAIVAMLVGTTGALAQTPTGMAFPYTPAVEDCQISPRSVGEILSLTGAGATGGELDVDSAASPDAIAAIGDAAPADQVLATIQELAACITARDMTRTFAFFSDGYLERLPQRSGDQVADDFLLNAIWATQGQFFLGDEDWAATLAGYLETRQTASPAPTGDALGGSILAIPAIWDLGADRVAAVVTITGLACFLQCDYAFILAQDETSGRYLIVDAIEVFDLAEVPSG